MSAQTVSAGASGAVFGVYGAVAAVAFRQRGVIPRPVVERLTKTALAFLGTVQLGLSYVLYSIAIKHVTAMEATLIPLLEPVLNPLWVMLLVGERPGFHALVGGAVVLGAVVIRGVLMVAAFRPTPAQASTATPD